MNLKQRVVDEIEQFVAQRADQSEPISQEPSGQDYAVEIPAEGDGAGASVAFSDFDRYSVTLSRLAVFESSPIADVKESEGHLRQTAAEISQRLSYLEEPLELLELDPVSATAQLRSNPPEQRQSETTYWEVTLQTTPRPRAELGRYRWAAGNNGRAPLAYPTTFAMLGRLTEDLARSLALAVPRSGTNGKKPTFGP